MAISTFLGLETALRGILAQQQALDVTGHNIANANTDGYTRQRVELTPFVTFRGYGLDAPVIGGELGGGVDVAAISRVRDQYLDNQYRAQSMRSGYYQALDEGLKQVDQTLGEPSDSGVSTLLAKFWSAWQDVANAPESLAARQALVQAGSALADGIQQLRAQLTTFQSQNGALETQTLGDLNSYTQQIYDLNTQIKKTEALGTTPNDLLDARDALVDKVSQLVNAAVTANSDGTVTITVGSGASLVTLVDNTGPYAPVTLTQLTTPNPPDPAALTSGKLKGLVDLDAKLTSYMGSLDAVAAKLIADVNAQQAAGFDLYGNAGVAFFSGTGASDIRVAAAVQADPKLVAASSSGAPGDGGNAIAAAGLGRASGGADSLYRQLVTTIGSDAQSAQRSSDAAQTLLRSISSRRMSVAGVSLDEEMANLLAYQRGFQASARALTAMDDMIGLLVTRTGRAGL
ncbi:MAG: flagellar hook-associated protein FlgK [Thermoleophilia bacterium]|nr:flagellar hook-associated protein FlgK [Thermoleophilia bacterium]